MNRHLIMAITVITTVKVSGKQVTTSIVSVALALNQLNSQISKSMVRMHGSNKSVIITIIIIQQNSPTLHPSICIICSENMPFWRLALLLLPGVGTQPGSHAASPPPAHLSPACPALLCLLPPPSQHISCPRLCYGCLFCQHASRAPVEGVAWRIIQPIWCRWCLPSVFHIPCLCLFAFLHCEGAGAWWL